MIHTNMKLPPTSWHVDRSTDPEINKKIREHTVERLSLFKHADKDVITEQIHKLDSEWDTERFLEANAATLVVATSFAALTKSKYWSLLSLTAGAFLLQHALQGWCPPVPIIRRMGVRTAEEINQEKMALKLLRRDFTKSKLTTTNRILKKAEKH